MPMPAVMIADPELPSLESLGVTSAQLYAGEKNGTNPHSSIAQTL